MYYGKTKFKKKYIQGFWFFRARILLKLFEFRLLKCDIPYLIKGEILYAFQITTNLFEEWQMTIFFCVGKFWGRLREHINTNLCILSRTFCWQLRNNIFFFFFKKKRAVLCILEPIKKCLTLAWGSGSRIFKNVGIRMLFHQKSTIDFQLNYIKRFLDVLHIMGMMNNNFFLVIGKTDF